MPTLTTRAAKGSKLKHAELDANFKRIVSRKTGAYTIQLSDNRSVIECSHATVPFTITLGAASAGIASDTGGFEVTITNVNTADVTVAKAGSDTIDGAAISLILPNNSSVTLKVNSVGDGYVSIAGARGNIISDTVTTGELTTGAITASGAIAVDDTTDSTSGTTGSIQTDGGLGVLKSVYIGQKLTVDDEVEFGWNLTVYGNLFAGYFSADTGIIDSVLTNSLQVNGGSGLNGITSVDNTTNSTSGTTGALHTHGGLGVVKDAFVGGKLDVGGNLTVTGSISTKNRAFKAILYSSIGGIGFGEKILSRIDLVFVDLASQSEPADFDEDTGRFQPSEAGWYQLCAQWTVAGMYTPWHIAIRKNSTDISTVYIPTPLGVGVDTANTTVIAWLNGSSDFVDTYLSNGATNITIEGEPEGDVTYFYGYKIA